MRRTTLLRPQRRAPQECPWWLQNRTSCIRRLGRRSTGIWRWPLRQVSGRFRPPPSACPGSHSLWNLAKEGAKSGTGRNRLGANGQGTDALRVWQWQTREACGRSSGGVRTHGMGLGRSAMFVDIAACRRGIGGGFIAFASSKVLDVVCVDRSPGLPDSTSNQTR